MKDLDTGELLEILNQVNKTTKLQEFTTESLDDPESLSLPDYLENRLDFYGLEKSTIIKDSNLSRTYAYQIFSGIRQPGRDRLLSICLAMGLNLKEIQRALCIAQLGNLYPKRRRDAVLIFAINKKMSVLQTNDLLFELGDKVLD